MAFAGMTGLLRQPQKCPAYAYAMKGHNLYNINWLRPCRTFRLFLFFRHFFNFFQSYL